MGWYNYHMHPFVRSALWVLGFAGAGVSTYFSLRAAGIVGELPRASGGGLLVDTLTMTSTKEDFVRAIMSAAARVRPSLSQKARGLLAAWAAHESGWGKTRQAKLANNLWNISKGSWSGPTLPGGDTEYTEGSKEVKVITQEWRRYATLDAAVADLFTLLENSRYTNYREAVGALQAGDETFVTRLGVFELGPDKVTVRVETRPNTAGFYTAPRTEYQRSISKLWVEVQSIITSAGLSGLSC